MHVAPSNAADLADYFSYAPHGIEPEPGLAELRFGEFLVEAGLLSRQQLLRTLQLQDRRPALRLGVCAVMLGYLGRATLARALATWAGLATIEL